MPIDIHKYYTPQTQLRVSLLKRNNEDDCASVRGFIITYDGPVDIGPREILREEFHPLWFSDKEAFEQATAETGFSPNHSCCIPSFYPQTVMVALSCIACIPVTVAAYLLSCSEVNLYPWAEYRTCDPYSDHNSKIYHRKANEIITEKLNRKVESLLRHADRLVSQRVAEAEKKYNNMSSPRPTFFVVTTGNLQVKEGGIVLQLTEGNLLESKPSSPR